MKLVRRPRFQKAAFAALALVGMGAAATFAGKAGIDLMDDGQTAVASETSSCAVGDRTFGFTLGSGGHPPKSFYEPAETIPGADFGHVISDGYLVVTYAPRCPPIRWRG